MSAQQDDKERHIKIGSKEDAARCRKLEQEERKLIARAAREHTSLSATAKGVVAYVAANARPWWNRMFPPEWAEYHYSVLIYSFSVAHMARTMAVTPEAVEKAMAELMAAEFVKVKPNRFGKQRDIILLWPLRRAALSAEWAQDHLARRDKVDAEYQKHHDDWGAYWDDEQIRRHHDQQRPDWTIDDWHREEAIASGKTHADKAKREARFNAWLLRWQIAGPIIKAAEERQRALHAGEKCDENSHQRHRADDLLRADAYKAAGCPYPHCEWRANWETWQLAYDEWEADNPAVREARLAAVEAEHATQVAKELAEHNAFLKTYSEICARERAEQAAKQAERDKQIALFLDKLWAKRKLQQAEKARVAALAGEKVPSDPEPLKNVHATMTFSRINTTTGKEYTARRSWSGSFKPPPGTSEWLHYEVLRLIADDKAPAVWWF